MHIKYDNNNKLTSLCVVLKNYMDLKMALSPVNITQRTGVPSNTFSVLSSMTPTQSPVILPPTVSVPLRSTPLSSARLTGLVSANTPIVPVTTPVSVPQTVNSFPLARITTVTIPTLRGSPSIIPTPSPTIPRLTPSPTIPRLTPSPTIPRLTPSPTIPRLTPSPTIPRLTPSPSIPTIPRLTPLSPAIPTPSLSPAIPRPSLSPTIPRTVPSPVIPQLTARTAIVNINNGTVRPSISIPTLSPTISIPTLSPSIRISPRTSPMFPTDRSLIVSPVSATTLPIRPTAEIMNQEFEVRDYQGIIANSNIETELLNAGYAPLSKIVVRADNGDKRTQYIKAVNKKGQKVFILIDVTGYTTARAADLTLIEAHSASIVPYSLKTGAYNCAGKDVCGVAFECGSDAVCVLARGAQDLTPKEANFVFVEQHAVSAATLESEGSIVTYPVIRLSEIRTNPALVLSNTDIVTRRLRNTTYVAQLQELAVAQQSINKLNESFIRFNSMREVVARKLTTTLDQLEKWNEIYMSSPPMTDEAKDKYRKLQFNLRKRNDGMTDLLKCMKKVSDKHLEIDVVTREINDITNFCEKEFANIDYATSE